jgi:hypothetical protein
MQPVRTSSKDNCRQMNWLDKSNDLLEEQGIEGTFERTSLPDSDVDRPGMDALHPCGQDKVREIQFFLKSMESLISNHAVASHSEQAAAARGEYFRAERR